MPKLEIRNLKLDKGSTSSVFANFKFRNFPAKEQGQPRVSRDKLLFSLDERCRVFDLKTHKENPKIGGTKALRESCHE